MADRNNRFSPVVPFFANEKKNASVGSESRSRRIPRGSNANRRNTIDRRAHRRSENHIYGISKCLSKGSFPPPPTRPTRSIEKNFYPNGSSAKRVKNCLRQISRTFQHFCHFYLPTACRWNYIFTVDSLAVLLNIVKKKIIRTTIIILTHEYHTNNDIKLKCPWTFAVYFTIQHFMRQNKEKLENIWHD